MYIHHHTATLATAAHTLQRRVEKANHNKRVEGATSAREVTVGVSCDRERAVQASVINQHTP
jgi:hypothetical protein